MTRYEQKCDNVQKSLKCTEQLDMAYGSTMQTAPHLKEEGLCQARTVGIGGRGGVVLHFARLDGDLMSAWKYTEGGKNARSQTRCLIKMQR